MRFAVAGGGVAGLGAALAVARAGHSAVVLDAMRCSRRTIPPARSACGATGSRTSTSRTRSYRAAAVFCASSRPTSCRRCATPVPRSRTSRASSWPARRGRRRSRLPLGAPAAHQWALRRAAAARAGDRAAPAAPYGPGRRDAPGPRGVQLDGAADVRADVVVDALARTPAPKGWPRTAAPAIDCGAIYYSRYFQLVAGARCRRTVASEPRGDLGYMASARFAATIGRSRHPARAAARPPAPPPARRGELVSGCAAIRPLDVMTSPDVARPITDVLRWAVCPTCCGPANSGRGVAAVGDALCHTNPSSAFGLHSPSLTRRP